MTSLSLVLFVVGLAINLGNVQSLSDEEKEKAHAAVVPHIAECSKEFGVTEEQLNEAKKSGKVDGVDPCLMACIFKKVGIIDDKGLYNPEKSEEIINKFVGSEGDKKKAMEIINSCKSINDEDVSDGEKGCDRANLLHKCFAPITDEFV